MITEEQRKEEFVRDFTKFLQDRKATFEIIDERRDYYTEGVAFIWMDGEYADGKALKEAAGFNLPKWLP